MFSRLLATESKYACKKRPSREAGRTICFALSLLFLFFPATLLATPERMPAIGQHAFETLTKVQELFNAEKYRVGHEQLATLLGKNLNAYEKAQAWSLDAYGHILQEHYLHAVHSYERLITLPDLPSALRIDTLRGLSRLHFNTENYAMAIKWALELEAVVPEPDIADATLFAQAYLKQKQPKKALLYTQSAITEIRSRGEKIPEKLWLILNTVYGELADREGSKAALSELVASYPKKHYVLALAALYGALAKPDRQLALMEGLYALGMLSESAELLQLAKLRLQNQSAYQAARLLQSEMRSGALKKDGNNLELLFLAWHTARDDHRAALALEGAAQLASNGRLYLRLAQLFIDRGQWQKGEQAIREALRKGKLTDTGHARLLLGVALLKQSNLAGAKKAFEKAGTITDSTHAARQWLAYLAELNRTTEDHADGG